MVPTQGALLDPLAVLGLRRPSQPGIEQRESHLDARQSRHHAWLAGHDGGPAQGVFGHQGHRGAIARGAEILGERQTQNGGAVFFEPVVPNGLAEFFAHGQ